MTFADGKEHKGFYENDKRNGFGMFTWPNGEKYEGFFVDDFRTGNGTYIWKEGDTYTGEPIRFRATIIKLVVICNYKTIQLFSIKKKKKTLKFDNFKLHFGQLSPI
jgi:hypothetical protein